ncbi:TetR/AcrR family transcriptional regulator [Arthrobacter mobilis]|uniref:TetR family transcriptional regulator n=1 Tax=Arthrobacter mobilis TaxID=2724944 RepID=A0A7X6HA58_9MICC|nr:TetR family transcriptional regulator [Arthrobacter mobilis]NKX53307.1 TetR family transcriptional regulator [Arthrobacter mobilis]
METVQSPSTPSDNPNWQAAESTGRRELIAEAATELIAREGMRALTHRAVDTRLGLPTGSTSYYFRTRDELLAATVAHLRRHSAAHLKAEEFPAALGLHGADLEAVAGRIARYLETLMDTCPHHIKARYALALELSGREDFADSIADLPVQRSQAVELFTTLGSSDPQTLAAGFIALLEGLLFRSLLEQDGKALVPKGRRAEVFREAIASYLLGVAESDLPA